MVVAGSFKFELVEASTKIPFKEHYKDGNTYVEAEPGAEFFISVHKTAKTETDVVCTYRIDDGVVNGGVWYSKAFVGTVPLYFGIRSDGDGDSHTAQTALMFVNPKIFHGSSHANSSNLLMGKVEVELREPIYTGRMVSTNNDRSRSSSCQFEPVSVDANHAAAGKKKNLRSDRGQTIATSIPKVPERKEYSYGGILETSK